jgi:hypothetical protein
MPIEEPPQDQQIRHTTEEQSVEPLSEVLHLVNAQINSIFEKANLLLQIKVDSAKFAVQETILKAGFGVLGLIVLSGVTVLSLFLFLLGFSYALSELLGNRLWLAHILTGIFTLSLLGFGMWFGLRRFRLNHLNKMKAKYATT